MFLLCRDMCLKAASQALKEEAGSKLPSIQQQMRSCSTACARRPVPVGNQLRGSPAFNGGGARSVEMSFATVCTSHPHLHLRTYAAALDV